MGSMFYASSVRVGNEDVLRNGFEVTATGGPADLQIDLTAGDARIEGTVAGAGNKEAAEVALVNEDADLVQAVVHALDGRFRFNFLGPGRYRIYAWPTGKEVEYRNREVLRALEAESELVPLAAGETRQVTVRMASGGEN
jgi:hypothetical protein